MGSPPPTARSGGSGILRLDVRIAAPDLRPFLGGNALPGVWSFAAAAPGPHVAVVALVHGNEIAGAVVLDRWLRAGLRPVRGRLSLVFANIDAYGRFDPEDPTASRFIDEDLNRLWDEETLEGGRRSCELRRARVLRPFFEGVDVLLDLHSMLWPSDPLMLVGRSARAADLALSLGIPPLVVADEGHASGQRLIDYTPFVAPDSDRAAILVEAGSHWEAATVATMEATGAALLRTLRAVDPADPILVPAPAELPMPQLAEVTRTVTAHSPGFAFVRPFRGGEVVPRRNTLLALDGEVEIRSPHDDCLLVMPSLRTMPGQTAVRLARFIG
ncbi:succinylglutamate desuccinylase/aspartoacylase family protein [Belnapia sp. T6]|uniref:Succinylglutamate desuccinylase/aspartoacylase family protein n=1 Tax=Belnapia mucosa TaxID=2804532 RepID=A0ABS1V6X5_9PROT|nr:succinylglutamate desuccinylase/aspartoacylase family protein [Belnapia mucosa]MBL6457087.1 succinylglutamate desuccinylase/aspartoacylase family protein [Belnapia mucosa]